MFTASVTTRTIVNLNIWLQLVMSELVSSITPNLLDSNKLLSVFNTQKYSFIESLLIKLFLHARFPLWHPQRDSTFFLIFRAHSLDPYDSEVLFHLALCQALMRQVNFIYRLLHMIASVFHWSKPLLTLTLLLNCSRSFSRALSSLVSWLSVLFLIG